MVTKLAKNLNGITIAYVMGLASAIFSLLRAFGVPMTPTQQGAIGAVLSAMLILAVQVGHRVGEAVATGASHAQSIKDTPADANGEATNTNPAGTVSASTAQ